MAMALHEIQRLTTDNTDLHGSKKVKLGPFWICTSVSSVFIRGEICFFVQSKWRSNQLLVALTAALAVKWFAVRKLFQGALWPTFNFLAPPAP
jgi:hypothetical protein